MAWFLLLLHLFLFHFLSFSSSSSSFNFSCHHDESSALLQFKASFTIDSRSFYLCDESLLKTATWKNGTDCCSSWHGVTCDTVSGHVIGLNLVCEGLQGIFHPNNTLFHLVHLQTIDLSNNNFSDSHFHSKFGVFQSLTHLDLSSSFFEGEIPTQISHLSKLQSLHLSWNYELVWKETTLKRLLQNATNLRELILVGTNMSSIRLNSIPLLFNQSSSLVTLNLQFTGLRGQLKDNILCLPSIQELDISYNYELEGQLPELSCSTSLRILDLFDCGFKGEIPTMSFYNLTHLTSLTLSQNHLNGSIPSSLLSLPRLTFLYLDHNELSSPIPNVFKMSNKFQKLDLSYNKIEGELPTSLSNLQHLITLDCSRNKLVGPLTNKITGFQMLTNLRLNDNLLNGTIPSCLLSLPSLVDLFLSNNRLTGHISAISSYSLETLSLSNNKLQGNIPKSIFNLPNLTYLYLSSNNLSGVVSFQLFSKLTNLNILSLSWNSQLSLNFESNVNHSVFQLEEVKLSSVNLIKFPKLQGKFGNLEYLDLSNNKLNGRMPNCLLEINSWRFLNLSQNLFTSIDQWINVNKSYYYFYGLDLSFNSLKGEIPLAVCNMSSLDLLNLGHNNLTGIIPQCLANSSSLQVLDLQMNRFHGTLPSNFSDVCVLQTLNLHGNQLEGQIPKSMSRCKYLEFLNLGSNNIEDSFPNLSSLQVLDLQMNRFYGTLPSNFSKYSDLRSLNLNGNRIEGHLPKSLSHCKKLEFLNLGNNKIDGKFPDWLHTLQDLKVLVLRDNKLHGPIPNLKIKHPFPSLVIFDISGNNLSGMLPKAYFKNYEAMKIVTQVGDNTSLLYIQDSTRFYDSMTVTDKGIIMTLVKIPINFVTIDLSRNRFKGVIPNVIGELHALKGLNLSHNRLTGPIPQSIINLTNLESLDLSSNMLTGMIPAELTNLNSLEVLDLSNNHLVGEIPQGKQFNTFTNDSYEGNLGLCGFPLSKKCGPEQHSPPSANNSWSEEKFGFGWKPVAIGYGFGFVFGIGLGYCMFLIGKPRWLVMIFGGQPKRRVTRRTRVRRAHGTTINQNQNQMVQMS